MTDFDGDFLAWCKNIVYDHQVAKCDITVRQTPNIFSNLPSLYNVYCINVYCFGIVSVNFLLNLL